MKYFYTVIFFIAAILFLISCEKSSTVFIPAANQLTGPDTNWYATISPTSPLSSLKTDLSLPPETDTFNTGVMPDTVNTASGLQFILPPNGCIDNGNNIVTGTLYLETYLLKSKGDLISMSIPTTSNNNLLISGGVLYLCLKNYTANLKFAPGINAHIRYTNSTISPMMKLFNGDSSNMWQYNWLPINDTSNGNNKIDVDNNEYEITTNELNWISSGYVYNEFPGPQTILTVSIPNNHLTNANTFAYVVFNDMVSVVNMQGDYNTKRFISNELPVGKNVTIVTISKDGDYYYLGHVNVTTLPVANSGSLSQDLSINPLKVSLSDIRNYLDSL